MRLGEARQRREFADAGIGDQDIDVPLRLDSFIESIEVVQFGDVSLNAAMLRPITVVASSSSFCRRPVMKT
jgi:hypothetical protein